MMQRLRHLHLSTAPLGEHNGHDEQQPTPVYEAIAQALRDCDPLRTVQYNDYPYETDVLWLLRHLPATLHRNDVEDLLKKRFGQQQESPQFAPEDDLLMRALAEDIWRAWSQYLQRHETATFSHARARAQGLMSRHYYPRTTRH